MSGELTKWNTLKSIVITQKEDLPKVKPNLAVADAAIKILKSRGDFKQLFEISEWQANLKRQAGRFVEGMEKGIPGPKKIGDIVSPNYKDHGFTRQDARRWRLHAIIPESELEAYRQKQLEKQKPMTQHDLLEIGKMIERHMNRERADKENPKLDDRILVGRFQDVGSKIKNGSVHLVLTDPPYDWKNGPELDELSKFAHDKLMIGGAFLCYVGQTQLPFAIDAFRKYLRYWWTIACLHAGSANLMQRYGIRASWKPLLMFVKETRHDTSHIFFDRVSGGEEKTDHPWQQAEAEAKYLIENLCPENGLVIDPCLGSGTTAMAAERLHRKWIGIEVDPGTAAIAQRRLT
jgi:hypothetical protein